MRAFDHKTLIRLTAITLVGGLVGSVLLLMSSDKAFSVVVPFLLLIATLAFLFGDPLKKMGRQQGQSHNALWR